MKIMSLVEAIKIGKRQIPSILIVPCLYCKTPVHVQVFAFPCTPACCCLTWRKL